MDSTTPAPATSRPPGPVTSGEPAAPIPVAILARTEQRQRQRDRLTKELARIDLAQRSQIT
jgi:hypothetical protein